MSSIRWIACLSRRTEISSNNYVYIPGLAKSKETRAPTANIPTTPGAQSSGQVLEVSLITRTYSGENFPVLQSQRSARDQRDCCLDNLETLAAYRLTRRRMRIINTYCGMSARVAFHSSRHQQLESACRIPC